VSKKFTAAVVALAFIAGMLSTDLLRQTVYAQEAKGPKWSHGLMLRVRKADQPDFDKNTPKVGVEVFVDENNGNLIYITDTGSISVVKK
jgi:hypothetical protein